MKQYRKKPVVVEAAQLTEENIEELALTIGRGSAYIVHNRLFINTLEGRMVAQPGDYVIKGVQGEFYPCKAEIFEQSYDEVGEAADAA